MCTLMSKPFSLSSISPRLTWDTLTQIPCYVQPALGPPRSCLIPRPALRKAGNGFIYQGRHAPSQTPLSGRPKRTATWTISAAGRSKAGTRKVAARCPESNGRRARAPHWLPSMTLQSSWRYQCRELLQFLLKTVLLPHLHSRVS